MRKHLACFQVQNPASLIFLPFSCVESIIVPILLLSVTWGNQYSIVAMQFLAYQTLTSIGCICQQKNENK